MNSDSPPMEHPRIEDEQILDRYLAGRLSEEGEALFEEHLFECRACLEQAEATRAAVSLSFLAWLRTRSTTVRAGFATLALALVVLPLVVVWQQGELRQRPSGSDGFAEPAGNFQVVSLGVVRDAAAEPVEIRPDPRRDAVLLSLELPAVEADRYRVILRDAAGAILWQGDELEPTLYDTLLVALPADYLDPGEYRIEVEAATPAGAEGFEPAGSMRLRMLP